ncbi:MarR family winged helix-turn-helix transcriptional regulator [Actinoplanes utahensis]|uniref:MarR family winged helix-turn-helix transcriptional regulator n=1 Tax=Actinoplanes utahensis TaxID=1869 RepID=UPI0035A24017
MLRANGEATHGLARRLGVGVTDAIALDHLLSSPDGLGPTELGHRLGIRSASATTLVDRLEAAGHAERVRHPSDRRRQTVVAGNRTRQQAAEALHPLIQRIEAAAARMAPDEVTAATAFLHEVAEAMRDYAGRA